MAVRHQGRVIAAVVVVVLVAAGGLGYWWIFIRKDQKPVDVAKVQQDFKAGTRGGTAGPGEPTPGVYLYDTTGTESVTALGGQTNTYPATTTLTITDTPCGVDAKWEVLTGRYDLNSKCRAADGAWSLTKAVVSDRFFNQTQVDTSTCTDLVELPAAPKAGTETTGRCVNGEATTDYVYKIVGLEPLTIGGTTVHTVHQTVTFTQGRSRSGGGSSEQWVQVGTNLVVKATSTESDDSPSPVGRVTYEQDSTVTLRSMTPTT